MKKATIFISIIVIIILGYFIFVCGKSNQNQQSSGNAGVIAGEVQKVNIGMQNSNYYPNTINVKAGIPVEITLDNSVAGCYRSFVMGDLGVRQYSASPSNKITFTPNKKGTFKFACSMGMGYGKIIVE